MDTIGFIIHPRTTVAKAVENLGWWRLGVSAIYSGPLCVLISSSPPGPSDYGPPSHLPPDFGGYSSYQPSPPRYVADIKYRVRTYFCKYRFSRIAWNVLRKKKFSWSQKFKFAIFLFSAHSVQLHVSVWVWRCSWWLFGYGCRIQVVKLPGQIFTSVNFRGQGFIHEYSENKYTAKISTYMYTVCYYLSYSLATRETGGGGGLWFKRFTCWSLCLWSRPQTSTCT